MRINIIKLIKVIFLKISFKILAKANFFFFFKKLKSVSIELFFVVKILQILNFGKNGEITTKFQIATEILFFFFIFDSLRLTEVEK